MGHTKKTGAPIKKTYIKYNLKTKEYSTDIKEFTEKEARLKNMWLLHSFSEWTWKEFTG